ncbi:PPOX class F420-dependent oxidoreductase [Prauserella marina]|uniref:PPOX class probable F420-dependent enzyme, Rv0121 family n=1 Tax=Prauserella marina TaxID=530584 RepID=A0A222VQZ3_9PSEU|nr:TIGR03668 family PPOX class F420-dependent oxidoreductase [Prauserella marina]ASR36163.1 PPOX class F420-dependent oxidoreductase [Prauserella marina]PWV76912.1 PPOX class probable F420-dependent enzyme [Prauserella marina]SDD00244.1 PPOX class probable F420-dependent enzyme, Rv0121 family [Prauserella marina]
MRLSEQEARDRFAAARVARLATVDEKGFPHLVPVTFTVLGNRIVFAIDAKPKSTTNLRRLRNIAANPAVAVLADHYDEDWSLLWWVRADGTATVLTDSGRDEPVAALTAKYGQYTEQPPRGPVVSITATTWRGWTASA